MNVREITDKTSCPKHDAGHGKPCWWIFQDKSSLGLLAAICNQRARAYGATGLISDSSSSRNYNKQGAKK